MTDPWSTTTPWLGKLVAKHYEIEALIGQGEASEVYRVRDVRYRHALALKLYSGVQDVEQVARHIERELDVLSGCRNPHLVRFYDVVQPDARSLGVIMDLVHGQTLEAYVSQRGALTWRVALRILRQLANALMELHMQQIAHLDLKPANVMIEELPSGEPFVHVLDFGSARSAEQAGLTRRSLSPSPYLSPEHVESSSQGPRSDLYSMGGLLHLMLTGRPPFEAQGLMPLIKAHTQGPRPELAGPLEGDPSPTLRAELRALLHALMAISPSDRLGDAQTLIGQIDGLMRSPEAQLEVDAEAHELFTRSLAQEVSECLSETLDEESMSQAGATLVDGAPLLQLRGQGLWSEPFEERAAPYEVAVSFETQRAALCFERGLELRGFLPEHATWNAAQRDKPKALELPEAISAACASEDLIVLGTAEGNLWRLWMTSDPRPDVWARLGAPHGLPISAVVADASRELAFAQTADGRLFGVQTSSGQWRQVRQLDEPALGMAYHGRSGALALTDARGRLTLLDAHQPASLPQRVELGQIANRVCYSPDGYLLVLAQRETLSVRPCASAQHVLASLARPAGELLAMGFSREGHLMGLIAHQDHLRWRVLWSISP